MATCPVCQLDFAHDQALAAHLDRPGKKHDRLHPQQQQQQQQREECVELVCDQCGRTDFQSLQALQMHQSNPGKQHTTRTSPCTCDGQHLRVTRLYRTADQFIYKTIFKCTSCGRHPITVPLPADRAMAVKSQMDPSD